MFYRIFANIYISIYDFVVESFAFVKASPPCNSMKYQLNIEHRYEIWPTRQWKANGPVFSRVASKHDNGTGYFCG